MNSNNQNNDLTCLSISSHHHSPMDPNDDVFSDANEDSPSLHSSVNHHDSPESSPAASTLSDPLPAPPPSPALRRRRSIPPRPSPLTKLNRTASKSDLIDNDGTSFPSNQNLEIFKEKIKDFPVTPSKDKVRRNPSSSVVTGDRIEESTLTSAASEDALADSADSAMEVADSRVSAVEVTDSGLSAMEVADSPSSSLEYAAGFAIRAILFQFKILIWLIKFPFLFSFYTCMFFLDPFGTWRKGMGIFTGILGRVSYFVFGCIGAPIKVIFKDQKTFWNVAFKCGWGFLWSIYVCCILFALVASSIVFSGFVMKNVVEKPTQMRKVLNFDYTKQSPVAYVPIISCDGVGGGGHDSEKDIAASRWVDQRAFPANQKVQVTVSIVVPESGYNRNLGIFQVRADYISYSGKTIASLSQPCMLKFRSEPIRLMTILLKIAPILTGFISETQTLDVKLKGFVESDVVPTSCLKITLEQRAAYLPGAGIPQIYDSFVVVESELSFFKRIVWNWKMSTFIWIAMTPFMTQLLFVLVCCWPFIIPRTRQRRNSASASASASSTGTYNKLQVPNLTVPFPGFMTMVEGGFPFLF